MTYGREPFAGHSDALYGAVVSHLAELVRGYLFVCVKAPSSALRAPSPVALEARLRHDGEKGIQATFSQNNPRRGAKGERAAYAAGEP